MFYPPALFLPTVRVCGTEVDYTPNIQKVKG
jgi:hypothetical protein